MFATRLSVLTNQIKNLQAHSKGRILIVEDEPLCLLGLRAMLKSSNIDVKNVVDVALNGREALDCIKTGLKLGL